MLLAATCCSWALDDAKKKESPPSKEQPSSLAEQIKKLETEIEEKRNELIKKVQATKDQDERAKIIKEFRELQTSSGPRLLELARKQPQDPAAFGALKSVIDMGGSPKDRKEVLKLLAEHHAKTAGIGDLAMQLAYDEDPSAVAFLEDVSKRNSNHDDQGKVLFVLGMIRKNKAANDDTKEEERARATAEATKAFEAVRDKFADVKTGRGRTLGKMAAGYIVGLKNIERLHVGKEAPDIEGQDLDGKPFKLSDYRGKVIFLDYWAHW
jgi:hypothetical protein